MNSRYAIFDMDGTLTDSMGYWHGTAREYLDSCHIARELQTAELMERIKTCTVTDTAVIFKEIFNISDSIETIDIKINAIMAAHYRDDVPLKPGASRYLRQLQASGVKLCVASATSAHLIDACLTRLGVRDCFDFLLSCEDVGASKSRPDVYLEAARRLGAPSAQDAAVYEDALRAAQTAKSAGFHIVGVYDSYADADWSALQALADETVTDWNKAADSLSADGLAR